MILKFLIFLFVFIIILILISEKEKKTLSINRVFLNNSKLKRKIKIVFLTDLHNTEFGKNNEKLIAVIEKEKPDYLLIGGDSIVTKRKRMDLFVLENLLKNINNICPVYYSNGNHEQRMYYPKNKNTYGKYLDDFKEILNRYNINYLNDSHYDLDDLVIYGLNLDEECFADVIYKKINKEYIYNKLGSPNKEKYNILLAHSPMFLDIYEAWGADLSLSGHFHGGVLRIGKQGVLTSQWHLFYKWCTGIFKINKMDAVVSRGLGGHTINVRLNNKPEITIIEIN